MLRLESSTRESTGAAPSVAFPLREIAHVKARETREQKQRVLAPQKLDFLVESLVLVGEQVVYCRICGGINLHNEDCAILDL